MPPVGDRRLRVVDRSTGAVVDPLSGAPPLPAGSLYAIVVAGHLLGEALGQSDLPCAHYVDASPAAGGSSSGPPRVSLVLRVVPPPGAVLHIRTRLTRELGGGGAPLLTTTAAAVEAFRASHESVTTGLGWGINSTGAVRALVGGGPDAGAPNGGSRNDSSSSSSSSDDGKANPHYIRHSGPVDIYFTTFTDSFTLSGVDRTIRLRDLVAHVATVVGVSAEAIQLRVEHLCFPRVRSSLRPAPWKQTYRFGATC